MIVRTEVCLLGVTDGGTVEHGFIHLVKAISSKWIIDLLSKHHLILKHVRLSYNTEYGHLLYAMSRPVSRYLRNKSFLIKHKMKKEGSSCNRAAQWLSMWDDHIIVQFLSLEWHASVYTLVKLKLTSVRAVLPSKYMLRIPWSHTCWFDTVSKLGVRERHLIGLETGEPEVNKLISMDEGSSLPIPSEESFDCRFHWHQDEMSAIKKEIWAYPGSSGWSQAQLKLFWSEFILK